MDLLFLLETKFQIVFISYKKTNVLKSILHYMESWYSF